MKKALRFLSIVLVVVIISITVHVFTDGMLLPNAPSAEQVERIVLSRSDSPEDQKERAEAKFIDLACSLFGYLRFVPFAAPKEDGDTITISFYRKDGTVQTVTAGEHTVIWQGKSHALKQPGQFYKLCSTIFFAEVVE
ncbi:MAG: hypothetical protein E7328_01030 [Clostridiales bacterium]|nr:hypothetical protein [Clostridiales bacterium]